MKILKSLSLMLVALIAVACSGDKSVDANLSFTSEGMFGELPQLSQTIEDTLKVTERAAQDRVRENLGSDNVLNRIIGELEKNPVKVECGDKQIVEGKVTSAMLSDFWMVDIDLPMKEEPSATHIVLCDNDGDPVFVDDNGSCKLYSNEDGSFRLWLNFGLKMYSDDFAVVDNKVVRLMLDRAKSVRFVDDNEKESVRGKVEARMRKLTEELKPQTTEQKDGGKKSAPEVKEGVLGDIPALYEEQMRWDCTHQYVTHDEREAAMAKIVTDEKFKNIEDDLLGKELYTIDEDGVTETNVDIIGCNYRDMCFSVKFAVSLKDNNTKVKILLCDTDGNTVTAPAVSHQGNSAFCTLNFIHAVTPAGHEEEMVQLARKYGKIAQAKVVKQ